MSNNPVKVMVGIPTEGYTQSAALHSIMGLWFRLGKLSTTGEFEFYRTTAGRLFTPLAREKLCQSALQVGADYILMLDDDMLFEPDLFEKLYRHKADIVAALAFCRNPPYSPVMYQIKEGYDNIRNREFTVNEWIRNYPKNKLVEVDAVGFGGVLINTNVLRNMDAPWFMSACGTGEDILFCNRAKKQTDVKIFMDTSVKMGHLGHPVVIDEAFAEQSNPKDIEKVFASYDRNKIFDIIGMPEMPKEKDGSVVMAGKS